MNVSHFEAHFVNALLDPVVEDGKLKSMGLGGWVVMEYPSLERVAEGLPTEEAAQAHALALNQWLDARPDPSIIVPFFNAPELLLAATAEERASEARLFRILDQSLEPELLAARLVSEYGVAGYGGEGVLRVEAPGRVSFIETPRVSP